MRIKVLCPILAILLFAHFTVLNGGDLPTPISTRSIVEYGESSFYGHLLLHDVRMYGIPEYEPYQGTEGVPPRKDPFIAGLLS
jgi:hypothetical protein